MKDDMPVWLKDLYKSTNEVPFGEIHVHRFRHRTNMWELVKEVILSPKTNEDAFLDLQQLLNNLVSSKFSGKLEFSLDFDKEGIINHITIKNKEIKKYGT